MKKNNIKWLAHIQTVLATIGTGRFTKVQDRKTYGVLSRALPDLFTQRGVDGDLKKHLLSNIAIRASVVIEHDGAITLSRHQRAYAKNMGWNALATFDALYADGQTRAVEDQGAETSAETELPDAELMQAFQQYFSIVSASFQHQFSIVSADMTPNLAEKLRFWQSSNVMETKLNHDGSMNSAKPIHEESVTSPLLPEGTQPSAINPPEEEEVLGQRKRGPRNADALTIWLKEDKRKGRVCATGNLDINGEVFPLSFGSFYGTLEAIPQTQANAEWHNVMGHTVADVVVPVEQTLSGVAAYSTMSGLHAASDPRCYKKPIGEQQVVILHWNDNKPVSATIIDGDERYPVSINQETGDRFKGAVKLA